MGGSYKGQVKKTFYDWCIENNHIDYLNLWDYDKNVETPKDVGSSCGRQIYFKCPNGKHKSSSKWISSITRSKNNTQPIDFLCHDCKPFRGISFADWCRKNKCKALLNAWDISKNKISANEISAKSNKKFHFQCPRGIHESSLKQIYAITREDRCNLEYKCPDCNTFGQWCLDNNHEDFLSMWSTENDVSPFDVAANSNKEYSFVCTNKAHPPLAKRLHTIVRTGKIYCLPCHSFGAFLLDTFGENGPLEYWSEQNEMSPFDISKYSNKKVYIKCQRDKSHSDYSIECSHFSLQEGRCPRCAKSLKTSRLQAKVEKYLIEVCQLNVKTENECSLVPKNPKTNQALPFDIEIPDYKLLIEVHGQQHYRATNFFKRKYETAEMAFHKRALHDRYKKFIAQKKRILIFGNSIYNRKE